MDYQTSRQFRIDNDLHASQGQRLANYLIDYIIQLGFVFVIALVLSVFSELMGFYSMLDFLDEMTRIEEYLLGIIILLIYYNIFEIFFSRTIGKFITKTIVINEFGEKPTTHDILIRSLCRLIPFNIFSFLGAPGKGWHDHISKTYVVRKELLEKKKRLFYSLDEIGLNNQE